MNPKRAVSFLYFEKAAACSCRRMGGSSLQSRERISDTESPFSARAVLGYSKDRRPDLEQTRFGMRPNFPHGVVQFVVVMIVGLTHPELAAIFTVPIMAATLTTARRLKADVSRRAHDNPTMGAPTIASCDTSHES